MSEIRAEFVLSTWREDPLLNEHHEHWHLVYPYEGIIVKGKHTEEELREIAAGTLKPRFLRWNNRHGELFAYMHAQLLARYAAERVCLKLPPVKALEDYRQGIPEGYQAGIFVKFGGQLLWSGNRPAGTELRDVITEPFVNRPGARIAAQEQFRDRLESAASANTDSSRPATLSDLAERVEATARVESPYFGALHNDGHVMISLHDNNPMRPGCMFWEASAVRDPVFYRWHAHVDQIFRDYRKSLPPHEFDDLPAVRISSFQVTSAQGKQNELSTEMRKRALRQNLVEQGRTFELTHEVDYLSHEDFAYNLNVLNPTSSEMPVTVRIFTSPKEHVGDETAWIEMDKFRQVLPPGESSVARSSRSSSVVRHPVWTAEALELPETGPSESGGSPGCRCGWPYTLLLPRGTGPGAKFYFIVLLTAGDDLGTHATVENSASYCGLGDSEYPDIRPMGYPFDRPFGTSITDWISDLSGRGQLAAADVLIKHSINRRSNS